jgi:1-deoxy-D-xylulose-5-phosphate synthase
MMDALLPRIRSPQDLRGLSHKDLQRLAAEMREALCRLAATRTAHFASNLGVVELAIALHTTFDFSRDRLIWDTGHQIYPHKMLTGRYDRFQTIRARGGLMGYPNPKESPHDLFMTGHAGCSISTALGLKCGDDLMHPHEPRHAVAVVGDGAFASGIIFEAMNGIGGLKKKLTVVLNDNKMSICPRVGGIADYLDRLRLAPFYTGLKAEIQKVLGSVPVIGDPVERFLAQFKDALKAGMLGGMLFEEFGFHYLGPVDGHNIRQLQKYLAMVRDYSGPVLLHVVTEKGHGFEPAAEDPTVFHAPAPFVHENGTKLLFKQAHASESYTQIARDALLRCMRRDRRVVVITAAMCQGNMLEPIREEFPNRFYDVGICESHAVAFAAGMAKAGARPVVDIYSTFLQRSYDQLFQEVALQNLPVTFLLDRAGIVGPDGPTHHGAFDLAYLRHLPNLAVLAPGDAADLAAMIEFAVESDVSCAIRYPKAVASTVERPVAPIRLAEAEVLHWGRDGMIVACGTLLEQCLPVAERLRDEGLDVGVINARCVKPLDAETLLRAVAECPWVVVVEEAALQGGFSSALLEAACDAGLNTARLRRLGIPDRFIEHGDRAELLAELHLDEAGIHQACLDASRQVAGIAGG